MSRADIISLIPCYDIAYEDELNTQGSWYTMISIIFIDAMVMTRALTEISYHHYFVYRHVGNPNHYDMVNKMNMMYYNIYALPNTYRFLSRHIAIITFMKEYVSLLTSLLYTYKRKNEVEINTMYLQIIKKLDMDINVYITL